MKKYIVMGVFAMGLTVFAASGFAEGREIYNWKEETGVTSGGQQAASDMDDLIHPDSPGEIYNWKKGKKVSEASGVHETTVADCIMSRSYPKRAGGNGGLELHKRLHTNHDDTACK